MPMTCEQFASQLTAFSLGELSAEEAAEAREHLQQCTGCTTLTLRDRQLVSMLRSSAVPAPASVHQAVRTAVRSQPTRGRRRRTLSPRLLAVAALVPVLAFALVMTVLANRDSPSPEEPSELLAAWDVYHADSLPYENGGPSGAGTWDLGAAGLRLESSGELTLAGLPATATEYRGSGTQRLVVFSWQGSLPETGVGSRGGDYPDVQLSSWGTTTSAWWEDAGAVFCAVGDLESDRTLMAAVGSIREGGHGDQGYP